MTEEKIISAKIKKEYDYFHLDMMRTSRENIFAHAEEIETKKRIVECVCRMEEAGEFEEHLAQKLEFVDNLLESVYCHFTNRRTVDAGVTAEEAVASLIGRMKKKKPVQTR